MLVISLEKFDQPNIRRVSKGPLLVNGRENCNTRKAKIYQFMQKAFEQNQKATVLKIFNRTFIMDNKGLEFPDIQEIEDLYVSRLEEGNIKGDSRHELGKTLHSEHYESITPEEVKICMSEFKKDTSSGPDLVTLVDLNILTFHEIAAIVNK